MRQTTVAKAVTVQLAGRAVPWVDAVAQMDYTITKELEYLYPCTEQTYATAYAQAHQLKHGTPFIVK
ncbi:MAG: hypothetical protein ACRCXB_23465 [Aeromonadaceae bacterium]